MNATTPTPRALLVDDDPVVLRLLGHALQARGFELSASTDAAGGIELLVEELLHLDVLVIDLDLPGRDGWSILRLVRDAGGERDLGIVVLVRDLEDSARLRLIAAGADAVVDRAAGPEAAAAAAARVATARRSSSAPEHAPRTPFLRWPRLALPALAMAS
ncbi:MAG TPA: response regulator [Anaeromyxobacteraceae bacterium]|nr:response regulator [Anaeromyxobacteraceae bacterium]